MLQRVLFPLLALLAPCACAQSTALPTVESLLAQLQANAIAYEARLPSLSCHEHISSQMIRNGKVTHATEVEDVVRVVRKPGGENGFEEQRLPVNARGEAEEQGKMPQMPLMITDAISGGQHAYVDALRHMACTNWTLDTSGAKLRLELKRNEHPDVAAGCKHPDDQLQGTALVDRASGQIVYQRHSFSEEAMRRDHTATYAETSYTPVQLGDETFWLPQRVYAEFGKDRHYTATYSGCKRYAGSARILDAVSAPGN